MNERGMPPLPALAAIEADRAQRVLGVPTDEQIKRHSMLAADCPGASAVILVSSLRRLLAAAPHPVAQPSDVPETNFGNTQPKPEQAAQPTYTEDEIADAAMLAEIPDSKLESLLIVLAASPKPKD